MRTCVSACASVRDSVYAISRGLLHEHPIICDLRDKRLTRSHLCTITVESIMLEVYFRK